MRVIAGTYRSRPLLAPRGTGTRPTSDRLRETLFNILAPRIAASHFADLYAGTGAVGIEALSRGAAHVFFAENAAPALATIRANLSSLKIVHNFTIEDHGAGALLERLVKAAQNTPSTLAPLDLVYLDPPWDAEAEYDRTLHLLGSPRGRAILSPNALVIAEHSSKSPLAPRFGSLAQTRTLKQGDAALTFYAIPTD
jgi:16S rRNA (guanine(966)-N(2))-methyltransferase RsmD